MQRLVQIQNNKLFLRFVLWICIPCFHFLLWKQIGFQSKNSNVFPYLCLISRFSSSKTINQPTTYNCNDKNKCSIRLSSLEPSLELIDAVEFDQIRLENLAEVPYVQKENTIIVHRDVSDECLRYVFAVSGTKQRKFCLGIVFYDNIEQYENFTWNFIRSDNTYDEAGQLIPVNTIDKVTNTITDAITNSMTITRQQPLELNQHNKPLKRPTGFFRKPPEQTSRNHLIDKWKEFLLHYNIIRNEIHETLQLRKIHPNDDVVVMVVNEGEVDLFLNFACSCQQHNISLSHMIVFSGSSSIIHLIQATGALAFYHPGYGKVSKKASNDYLDSIFVDMVSSSYYFLIILLIKINIDVV